ncbi:PREDICTED: uncharacterized protein LOC104802334 [Tarenaya hassleriana]|uniref:uncharacterized protein LOC104802334 n=1 Tax=Tarenaya hassleriana TaxID=28532 RepID=UPI00053C94B3|nr:PREDICTED: uncharacterized protein LOC104802334 [Tarenaya hassleriana]
MLPFCSAASGCHHHSRLLFPGIWQGCSPLRRDVIDRCSVGDNAFSGISDGTPRQKIYLSNATRSFLPDVLENPEESSPVDFFRSLCPDEFDNINYMVSDRGRASVGNDSCFVRDSGLTYIDNDSGSIVEDFAEPLMEKASSTIPPVEPETISAIEISPESSVSLPEVRELSGDQSSLLDVKTSFDDFASGVNESFNSSLNKGESTLKSTLDAISSSLTSITKNASEVVDSAVRRVFSTVNETGDVAGNKFSSFSSDLKVASSRATVVAIDLLRQTLSTVENIVTNGVSFIVYSYGSAKESLPPDVRSSLSSSEEGALKVLKPMGAALEQVYIGIEALERNVGLNPDDPIVHFFLIVGTSGTFWVLYRLWVYGGYAGDLSPKKTMELLASKEKSILVDVRPEALREKDGIPDLRRTARFRYASVTSPEIDDAVKRLLKGGREVDDILTAVIIKNLKVVQDRSKVIVMDVDGTCSKGIARSLRKLGIKRPYMVQGGFRSWVKEGLRVKEPKPETALTILNEEAEAILESINPSPLQLAGVGVGFVASLYAFFEWENTLQLIGVVGLGQTIYRRLSSYEDSEDFKQDLSSLLRPVRLGAQAFSWAAGKLETNGVGLPTSPSSSDVQSRVLQAAAKHESKPSDSEGLQDEYSEGTASVSENVDLSEA